MTNAPNLFLSFPMIWFKECILCFIAPHKSLDLDSMGKFLCSMTKWWWIPSQLKLVPTDWGKVILAPVLSLFSLMPTRSSIPPWMITRFLSWPEPYWEAKDLSQNERSCSPLHLVGHCFPRGYGTTGKFETIPVEAGFCLRCVFEFCIVDSGTSD